MIRIINGIEYYSKTEILKIFNLHVTNLNIKMKNGELKFIKFADRVFFEKSLIDNLPVNYFNIKRINVPIKITNDVNILTEDIILYNDIKLKRHPIYTNYYFNSDNIKIIIKKDSKDFVIIKPSLYHRAEHAVIEQTTIYHNNIKKTYNVSKLILETFKSHPENCKGLWCNHFNDLQEDNDIKNMFFADCNINTKTMGLNCKINKNIYELIKYTILNEPLPNYENIPNTVSINGINCIKVQHPEMSNVFISLDGKYVFENNQLKNEYARYLGPNNYRKVWLIKKDINIHHLMGWAKYGYFNLKETNKKFLHVNDITEDCSYFNMILGNAAENGISQSENTEKYKSIRRMLIKDYPNEYPKLLIQAIDMLHPNYKKLYKEIKQMLIDSNNQIIIS